LDIVLPVAGADLAVELKICEFPRRSNLGNRQALYDVGQLLWDAIGIREAGLSGFVLPVLYTTGAYPDWSEIAARRAFHNSMFCDLEQSLRYGELGEQRSDEARVEQLNLAAEFGWNAPFGKGDAGFDGFVVQVSDRLMGIGYFVQGPK
jgi:hypothetical protein